MDEKILQGLIEANQAEKERTPYLDMALGGLRTALDNLRSHHLAVGPQRPANAGRGKKADDNSSET